MREVLGVDLIHGGEVAHAGEEDVDFDDFGDRGAGALEDGFEVLAAGARFVADAAGDEVARGGGGELAWMTRIQCESACLEECARYVGRNGRGIPET